METLFMSICWRPGPLLFSLVVSAAGRYRIVMFSHCFCSNRKCQVWLQGGKREDEKFLKGARCFFDDPVSHECEMVLQRTHSQVFIWNQVFGWQAVYRTLPFARLNLFWICWDFVYSRLHLLLSGMYDNAVKGMQKYMMRKGIVPDSELFRIL